MAEGPKRVHDPPTGQTPGKKTEKRRSGASGKEITVPVRYRFRTGCGAEESEGIYL